MYSSDEGINIITLILLIEGKTTIEKIADRLGVSKNTIIQDFKSVKDNFKNSNIKIRNTFFRLSNDLKENKSINMEEWIVMEQDFSKNIALNIISKIEKKLMLNIQKLQLMKFLCGNVFKRYYVFSVI